jgi:hypothetical protein
MANRSGNEGLRLRAVAIGFPKSGTSTLYEALLQAGLRSVHWTHHGEPIGKLIYDGWLEEGDPFARMKDVDAITQMDYCHPAKKLNYWPNLDFAILTAIRAQYPDCLMILNTRPAEGIASSIERWGDMQYRITSQYIPGLPAGRGRTREELVRWVEGHFAAARATFGNDPRFLELDITAPDAAERLGAALGIPITWWGRANTNPKQALETGVVALVKPALRRALARFR